MATISWSASQLYKLTGKPSYADIAAEYIRYTLDCQRTEPLKDKTGHADSSTGTNPANPSYITYTSARAGLYAGYGDALRNPEGAPRLP